MKSCPIPVRLAKIKEMLVRSPKEGDSSRKLLVFEGTMVHHWKILLLKNLSQIHIPLSLSVFLTPMLYDILVCGAGWVRILAA